MELIGALIKNRLYYTRMLCDFPLHYTKIKQ